MSEFPRLSNREWDVLKLLLQGKSNKLIALSLGISDRTVEFHLKNIYAKFQVSSRIELILKLVNATGGLEAEKLGHSTVADKGESAENRDRLNLSMSWAGPFRETVSVIGKESEMKNLLSAMHMFVGMATALLAGLLWVLFLINNDGDLALAADDFTIFTIPLIFILIMIGLTIGFIGKLGGKSLQKVFFSALLGTGLSPLAVIPLMMFAVIPIGRLVANLGIFDLSAMPAETASAIAMGIMLTLWLIVSIALGFVLLMVSISIKLRPTSNHDHVEGSA